MTGHNTKPLVIWRISDGRAGHDSQSYGLVLALEHLTSCEYYSIEAKKFKNRIFNFMFRKFPSGKNLPDPDLIVGAGHKTHMPMLCAKRARGGKTIVIMKPSLPYGMFDHCIVSEHDNPPRRENIITVQGALNTIIPGDDHDTGRGLVLIGGPSKHYAWDTEEMINQLVEITGHDPSIHWTVSDSPRTPADFMSKLTSRGLHNVRLLRYENCKPGELANLYASSGTVWVSEDSVSMIYEALTSGACVGVLQVPRKPPCKLGSTIDELAAKDKITLYKEWHDSGKLNAPVKSFNESERCARFLYQKVVCN